MPFGKQPVLIPDIIDRGQAISPMRNDRQDIARQASGCLPVAKGVIIGGSGFRQVSEKPCRSVIRHWSLKHDKGEVS